LNPDVVRLVSGVTNIGCSKVRRGQQRIRGRQKNSGGRKPHRISVAPDRRRLRPTQPMCHQRARATKL